MEQQLVHFMLDGQAFALPLQRVQRVFAAAEVTPVPELPAPVQGVVDIAGDLLPVLDLRHPPRPVTVDDQFLLIQGAQRRVVLVVDRTLGVLARTLAPLPELPPCGPSDAPFEGAVRCDDGVVLVHDSDRFVSDQLARALEQVPGLAS